MRVLVEQYSYKVEDLPPELRKLERESNGKVSFDRVGYYLDDKIHDCVFILPKVVLWDGSEKVLGEFAPEEFVDLDALEEKYPEKKTRIKEIRRFIYEFSTWIYRAIKVYNKAFRDNDIVLERHTQHTGHTGRRRKSETLLDVLLSIQDFAKENRDFFFFVVKNRHSGLNKINWTRTITKCGAVVQDGGPAYLNPVNKKRQINFDEELLVIFFSILNYMNETYGFSAKTDLGYELIAGSRFVAYVEKGLGKRRLLKIKYKYFSDKALKLWDLCYAFFEHEHQIFLTGDHEEYLLVKKFDRVFEAMIDELVGDEKSKMPKSLTKQDDGKLVDHMYLYRELIENKAEQVDTFYIGDSKYYKYGTQLGTEAVYKQFTYAKNVVQWRLNLFMDDANGAEDLKADKETFVNGKKIGPIRDDVTEGYDVTPNFFISAMMTEDLRGGFKDEKVIPTMHGKGKQAYFLKQFENRLFDRDTLIVAHYDVNFLFVLSLYAQDKAYRKATWKDNVRRQFRKEIQGLLAKEYKFWAMTPKSVGSEGSFLRSDFQRALGKVYKPYGDDPNGRPYYSLALESSTPAADVQVLKDWLGQAFFIEECKIGEDPAERLALHVSAKPDKPQHYIPMELLVASRYEQVSDALLKTIKKAGYYIARAAPAADPPPDKIGRVFLFSGEPKSLSAIADLTFVAANISKVDLLNKLPMEAAQNGRAIADELQKAMPNTAISLDVWKIDKWLDA